MIMCLRKETISNRNSFKVGTSFGPQHTDQSGAVSGGNIGKYVPLGALGENNVPPWRN